MLLLLGCHGLVRDPADLQEAVYHLFDEFSPFCPAVLGEYGVAPLVGLVYPRRHSARGLSESVDLLQPVFYRIAPLETRSEFAHLFDELFRLSFLDIGRQIFYVRPPADAEAYGVVRFYLDVLDVHPVSEIHQNKSLPVHLGDRSRNADRIEAVLIELIEAPVLLSDDEDHPLARSDLFASARLLYLIYSHVDRSTRRKYYVVYRYYYHFCPFPFPAASFRPPFRYSKGASQRRLQSS